MPTYSQLSGFSAINTKPYRPIGELTSLLNGRRIQPQTTSTSTTKKTTSQQPEHQYETRVRFSNKQYKQVIQPRLKQRKADVNSLKVGASANGGIFRFVKPPHAIELAEHTARHAFYVSNCPNGHPMRRLEDTSKKCSLCFKKGIHYLCFNQSCKYEICQKCYVTTRTNTTNTTNTTTTTTNTTNSTNPNTTNNEDREPEYDYDDDDDGGDDEQVRLKTRNEIWAETHLANVSMKRDKKKTPKRLRSKFLVVDQKFRKDVQNSRVVKVTGKKNARDSAWRNKRMHKQMDKEQRVKNDKDKKKQDNNNAASINKNKNEIELPSTITPVSLSTKTKGISLITSNQLKPKPPVSETLETEWDCCKCKTNNYGGRNKCYKCGTQRMYNTSQPSHGKYHNSRAPGQGRHNQSPRKFVGRRARRRSTISRLELAHSIFAEELPTGENYDSPEDDDDSDFLTGMQQGPTTKDSVRLTTSKKTVAVTKVPSYVSSNMGNKTIGGGLAGLNVAYAQSQDPLFWEHYSREMTGALRKSDSNEVGNRGRSDKNNKLEGIGGGRLVGKELNYQKIKASVNKSSINRHRFRKNIRGIGKWQKDLWENYQRQLEVRDIKRVDVLRQGTMVARADQFLDKVLRESHTAAKAMSMVRGAAGEINQAQARINKSRVQWYNQVEAEKPLSKPHHMMRELLLELCHSGHPLVSEVYFHSVLCTYRYCGTRACGIDGPFQNLVRKMRIVLKITTEEYVAWLGQHKMPVPRVLLAELQQEELDRREQEEDRIKMKQMLEHDGNDVTLQPDTSMGLVRPTGPPNVLAVKVLQARKLLPADLDGLADPLVYCWMAPMWSPEGFIPEHTQRAYTEHAPKTLDPNWEALGTVEEFLFDISDEFWGLSVAVYDHDEHGDNDVMSYCRVGLNVVRSHNHSVERYFTLKFPPTCLGDYEGPGSHAHHKVHFGEIKLKLEWYNKLAHEWDLKNPVVEDVSGVGNEDSESDEEYY